MRGRLPPPRIARSLGAALTGVLMAIVLAGTAHSLTGELAADPGGAAEAFRRVFLAAAASMSIALIALALIS